MGKRTNYHSKYLDIMKYVAAYCLAVLGGNNSPSAADVEKILKSVDSNVDAEKVKVVIESLKGKNLSEVMTAGLGKLSSMSFGGSGGARAGPAQETAQAGGAKEEEKKEEEVEEEEEDMDFDALFG